MEIGRGCDGFRCSTASPGKPQHIGIKVKVTTLDTLLTGPPHSRFVPQLPYVPLHGVEAESAESGVDTVRLGQPPNILLRGQWV